MANPRKRSRWDVAPEPVRMRMFGPKLPGGQQYSQSDQARADPRNRRVFNRTGGFYGRFSGPNAELKFFDTALSFAVDTTGEVPATGQLALIPQGVTESTRVGRRATVKSIQIRATAFLVPGAGTSAASLFAIYVVQDTQTNGAAAGIGDVLTSGNMLTALIELQESGRFRILKKIVRKLTATAGVSAAYNEACTHIEFYKKVNIPIEYSSTTGAITEIRQNNIFLLAGAIGSDDTISVQGNCRLRFSDS